MLKYQDLLNTILTQGSYKEPARANMPGTTSLFGYQFAHDLSKGFPLLTTKKMFFKGVVIELLWFLRGDTNIKYLLDNGVNIWNEDAYNFYTKQCKITNQNPVSFADFIEIVKRESQEGLENISRDHFKNGYCFGDCGFQYGKVWRKWKGKPYVIFGDNPDEDLEYETIDQIKNVIESLKSNPYGRRHIVTAWDPANDNELALTWCHAMFQFNCRRINDVERAYYAANHNILSRHELMFDVLDNPDRTLEKQLDEAGVPKYKLDCQLYQRSADVFLGVPFNIASYALLTELIAKICNMIPGEFIHTFGDVHIYDNHREAVREQMSRVPYDLPTVEVLPNIHSDYFEKYLTDHITLDEFLKSLSYHDFKLKNYTSHDAIKAELSTGLKK